MEQPTRWSLNDLLREPIEQSLEETFSKLEQALGQFEAMRELLTSEISLQDFQRVLAILKSINILKSRIEGYADLAFAENTQNPAALNLRDRSSIRY